MSTVLAHPEDCVIDRSYEEFRDPNLVLLRTHEGRVVHMFPREWTDEQIHRALAFANASYAAGVTAGKKDKEEQVRKVLGMSL